LDEAGQFVTKQTTSSSNSFLIPSSKASLDSSQSAHKYKTENGSGVLVLFFFGGL
jgi:hypothetical protein